MKRPAALRQAIVDLWSNDTATRLHALASLDSLGLEMVDIRTAQPAIVACLNHPDIEVRRAAMEIIAYRADMGMDVGMSVPRLLELRHDPDPDIQSMARRALGYANERLGGLLTPELGPPG
jgi:hypothetical protein